MERNELIKEGLNEAESIISQTTSYLCNAITHVKDKERVDAFNVMYAIMRVADNLVDDRKDNLPENLAFIKKEILKWKEIVDKCYEGNPDLTPISAAFYDSLSKFNVPKNIWNDFFSSMIGDLENRDFWDFLEFQKYCIGATCAPTIIYLFILLSEKNNGVYEVKGFDYIKTGNNLGIWAYMIHILRDVKKDADNKLFYLPERELSKFELKKEDIVNFSKRGTGDLRYLSFVNYYLVKANEYYLNSINDIEVYLRGVSKDRMFAVLIILKIYEEIDKRLQVIGEKIFSGEKVLSAESYKDIEENLMEEIGLKNG
ncbi:squalene/phytoene synthase family protein [Candidatus Pacearchaeota archaeon]|nr:squalene/phytoene synthase family protein [Candidatus Pacearchaeota archaeon]